MKSLIKDYLSCCSLILFLLLFLSHDFTSSRMWKLNKMFVWLWHLDIGLFFEAETDLSKKSLHFYRKFGLCNEIIKRNIYNLFLRSFVLAPRLGSPEQISIFWFWPRFYDGCPSILFRLGTSTENLPLSGWVCSLSSNQTQVYIPILLLEYQGIVRYF